MVGTLLGLHDSEVSDKPLGELGVDGGGLDDGVGRSACIFMSSSTALLLFFVVDSTLVACSDDITFLASIAMRHVGPFCRALPFRRHSWPFCVEVRLREREPLVAKTVSRFTPSRFKSALLYYFCFLFETRWNCRGSIQILTPKVISILALAALMRKRSTSIF